MVGPLPDEERRTATNQLRVGFVVLVGTSAGLMALQGKATPVEVVALTAVGLAVGVALLAFLGAAR